MGNLSTVSTKGRDTQDDTMGKGKTSLPLWMLIAKRTCSPDDSHRTFGIGRDLEGPVLALLRPREATFPLKVTVLDQRWQQDRGPLLGPPPPLFPLHH